MKKSETEQERKERQEENRKILSDYQFSKKEIWSLILTGWGVAIPIGVLFFGLMYLWIKFVL